jgi:hypothetical protein
MTTHPPDKTPEEEKDPHTQRLRMIMSWVVIIILTCFGVFALMGLIPSEIKVAHKTGWITGVHHVSGIVYLPDGRKYILVLLSKNLEDKEAGVKAMAAISRRIYEFMQSS